jgi:Co/Zn/Cd efflux system component
LGGADVLKKCLHILLEGSPPPDEMDAMRRELEAEPLLKQSDLTVTDLVVSDLNSMAKGVCSLA